MPDPPINSIDSTDGGEPVMTVGCTAGTATVLTTTFSVGAGPSAIDSPATAPALSRPVATWLRWPASQDQMRAPTDGRAAGATTGAGACAGLR